MALFDLSAVALAKADFPSSWLPLVDAILKATIVLGAAAVAAFALRRASAALRHLIWTLALTSALLMPVLSIALPRWQLPIVTLASPELVSSPIELAATAPPLPSPHLRASTSALRATADKSRSGGQAESPAPAFARSASAGKPSARVPSVAAALADVSWPTAIAAIWLIGVLLIVGRVIVGLIAVQWMARRSQPVLTAPWLKMAVELASEVGVSSAITFLRNGRATMPMACGVLQPAVMMPAEADEWPADRLRIVLLHELAHVRRRDCLTHLVAQVACAFHWFNPLAWVAARNLRTERERACDDFVLAAGTHGPDYADQLLEIARVMRSGRYPAVLAGATLAMAHRSQLEGRLMAILDPRVPHAALTRLRAAAATVVCCGAVIPLAAVQAWGEAPSSTPVTVVATAPDQGTTQSPSAAPAPTPTPRPMPAPARRDAAAEDAAGRARSIADATVSGTVNGTLTGTVGGTVQGTLHGVMGGPIGGVVLPKEWAVEKPHDAGQNEQEPQRGQESQKGQESKPAGGKADPRMVEALTAALKDTDKEVRETAMHALVQMRDPSIFEPLVQALKDAVPDVREQAAFGLGQLRDRRAVEPLSAALKDQHPDVREQAAFALGQIRDRGAIAALNAAIRDSDADVREQVIFALGQFRDPATFEGLVAALRDTNGDVRQQAVFALGQLRDRRAVEPLISSLKDTDAEVREQAAFALGQIRDRGAVEALVIALRDSSAKVREQVAFALGQIRDPRAIEGLTTALKDPQANVRRQAAFALGQLAR